MRRARDPLALQSARFERDLTLRELALLVGCSDRTIRKVLAGAPTRDADARRLSRCLRRPVDQLFEPVDRPELDQVAS